jgi:hypothetical protein
MLLLFQAGSALRQPHLSIKAAVAVPVQNSNIDVDNVVSAHRSPVPTRFSSHLAALTQPLMTLLTYLIPESSLQCLHTCPTSCKYTPFWSYSNGYPFVVPLIFVDSF